MRIDGETIDPQELSAEFRRLMESQVDRPDSLRVSDHEVQNQAVENVINKWLLQREARKRFPHVKPEELRRRAKQLAERFGPQFDPSRYQHEMEDDARIDKLVQEINTGVARVTRDEAREEFERDPSQYAEPEQVHVSHIVRHTFGGADPGKALQQIMEAQRMLKQGTPFEVVARQFSDQHGQAGDLGTFARGAMVEKFENVAFRMAPGELSDVFQTEFGYHIALVHERHPARDRSFGEAMGDVVATLRRRREQEAFDDYLTSLREAAIIERDEEGIADENAAGRDPTDDEPS